MISSKLNNTESSSILYCVDMNMRREERNNWIENGPLKVIVSVYILASSQCTLRFTPDIPTPTRLLWEAFNHVTITAQILLGHIYPPLSLTLYSFIQLTKCQYADKAITEISKWQQAYLNTGLLNVLSAVLVRSTHEYHCNLSKNITWVKIMTYSHVLSVVLIVINIHKQVYQYTQCASIIYCVKAACKHTHTLWITAPKVIRSTHNAMHSISRVTVSMLPFCPSFLPLPFPFHDASPLPSPSLPSPSLSSSPSLPYS